MGRMNLIRVRFFALRNGPCLSRNERRYDTRDAPPTVSGWGAIAALRAGRCRPALAPQNWPQRSARRVPQAFPAARFAHVTGAGRAPARAYRGGRETGAQMGKLRAHCMGNFSHPSHASTQFP